MNCKQGDLARVVAPKQGDPAHGFIVRCLHLVGVAQRSDGVAVYGPIWVVDPPVPIGNGGVGDRIHDDHLRPIDNPGDDAVDESHAWLPPVPTTPKEIA